MEKLVLECQRSFSKSCNEKPLIWRSIRSFQAQSRVGIRVLFLISLHIILDFNLES